MRLTRKQIEVSAAKTEGVLSGALRWPLPEFRQLGLIPVRSRWSFVSFFSFFSVFFLFVSFFHHPLTHRGNFFLALRAPPVRRPFTLPGYQLCPRGPHVATADPPVCVSHLHEEGAPVLASLSLAVGVEIPV